MHNVRFDSVRVITPWNISRKRVHILERGWTWSVVFPWGIIIHAVPLLGLGIQRLTIKKAELTPSPEKVCTAFIGPARRTNDTPSHIGILTVVKMPQIDELMFESIGNGIGKGFA